MEILTFALGPLKTNLYIVICKKTNEAVIIDPGQNAFEIVKEQLKLHGAKAKAIWLTHSHFDHIVDVSKIKEDFSIPIYIHKADKGNLEVPGSDLIPLYVPLFEGAFADYFIKEEQELKVGSFSFKVIHTPGHSEGGVCFYCKDQKILFSGDTLFKGAIGILNLPTSDPLKMKESLAKLFALPEDTMVYPGHGKTTTIKQELSNRWF
jgi:hydroxyacylglutathione hydrolase